MRFLRGFRTESRGIEDFIDKAMSNIEPQYSPELGADENGKRESKVGLVVQKIVPYDCILKEVDIYA